MKVLMSIKPKFVKQIFEGIKLFELRKKIVGEFIIDKIISATPQKIYLDYGESLGISKNEYFKYFKNVDIAYAIKIKKVIKYEKELTLADFNLERAPQSYQYIE